MPQGFLPGLEPWQALGLDAGRQAMIAAANELPRQLARWGADLHKVMVDEFTQLGGRWRAAREVDLPRETEAAMQDCADILLRKAQEYSSRRFFSLKELRRMGHPYATRYGPGSAGIPDFLVNYQGGRFLSSWQAAILRRGETDYDIVLTNTAVSKRGAPYGSYLFTGTQKMRQRPIIEAVFEHTKEEREARLAEAVRKADP